LTRAVPVRHRAPIEKEGAGYVPRTAAALAALCAAVVIALAAPSQASAAWKLRFVAGFNHGLNTSIWTRYNGTPRCCHNTRWRRSHVVVRGGLVRLQNYRDPAFGNNWVSGGMSMGRSLNQTYGRYRVRFRITKGRGVGMCMFLWPKRGWPPEIDFAEESSAVGGRRWETSTLHYGSRNLEIHHRVRADFTQWHTIGLNWRPGRIVYVLDGHMWAQIRGSQVPNVPMHLGIQTHVGSNGQTGPNPDSTTPPKVGLQVDWIKIWRWR
jgi:beta-glucanase (GH16 family)